MNFKHSFPILEHCTYLNTAYSGLLPKEMATWRRNHDEAFLNGGSTFRMENFFLIDELRANLGGFFNTPKEQIYLVTNFSSGFNALLAGLPHQHRFLILKEDYPSLTYPIMSSGFDYHEVEIDDNIAHNIIQAVEKFKPTVLALSLVQYISGFAIDPNFLKQLKTNYPDLLIVADGTQFCGTTNFDFSSSGLDALISSGYKWMLGGYGNGFVLLSSQMQASIYIGKSIAEKHIPAMLAGRDHLSICFEPGHLDTLNFGSLNEGLKYLQILGLDFIKKENDVLTQLAREEFYNRGLITVNELQREVHSTIISLQLSNKLVQELAKQNIIYSARGTGTRFSFHFYNTKTDLSKLLEVIDSKH